MFIVLSLPFGFVVWKLIVIAFTFQLCWLWTRREQLIYCYPFTPLLSSRFKAPAAGSPLTWQVFASSHWSLSPLTEQGWLGFNPVMQGQGLDTSYKQFGEFSALAPRNPSLPFFLPLSYVRTASCASASEGTGTGSLYASYDPWKGGFHLFLPFLAHPSKYQPAP